MTAGAERWLVLGNTGPRKAKKAEATKGKSPRFYPADDVKRPKPSRKSKNNPPRVRKSISAGTILILLAGRFRGKRVVCLKVLTSGLLLISGPFKINGVPLRRVNPAYVIATSTKIDVSSIDVSSIDDKYFESEKKASGEKEGEEEFFLGDAPKPAIVSDSRKADQKKVDEALLKLIEGDKAMKYYLGARFSLQKGDRPHKMIF